MLGLRPGVVAVFQNNSGEILLFERADKPGIWQFPQGGVEDGETPDMALYRELHEEVGTGQVKVLKKAEHTTMYYWPPHKMAGRVNRYAGQEHTWYLCEFLPGAGPRLESSDGSFRAFEWCKPEEVVARNVDWKRASMSLGLRHLGLVS